jgi:hypothetical protein
MSGDNGGAAFPSHDPESYERRQGHSCNSSYEDGMTLLDYFAGQALAGLCANGNPPCVNGKSMGYDQAAYMIAQGMLTERARRTEKL